VIVEHSKEEEEKAKLNNHEEQSRVEKRQQVENKHHARVQNVRQHRSDLFESAAKRESIVECMIGCERHFETEKPASLYNKYDFDWVPRLNMGYLIPPEER
jgi:hypothetical protein